MAYLDCPDCKTVYHMRFSDMESDRKARANPPLCYTCWLIAENREPTDPLMKDRVMREKARRAKTDA